MPYRYPPPEPKVKTLSVTFRGEDIKKIEDAAKALDQNLQIFLANAALEKALELNKRKKRITL